MSLVHGLQTDRAIPGYALRALLFLTVVGATLALFPESWLRLVPVALALLAAVYPSSLSAWLALALMPLGMLLNDPDPLRTVVGVLAVHAIHILGTLTLAIPARARVQLRALRPTVMRFLRIQAMSQGAVLVLLLLMTGGAVGFAWLAPVGAGTLLGLTALLLRHPRVPLAKR